MRARTRVLLALPLLLAATACGGSDDDASDAGDATDNTSAVDVTDAADVTDADAADPADTSPAAAAPSASTPVEVPDVPSVAGGGTAVLTLENGETFEFEGVMCTLEPQMAAGSEILFTATSYGDPGLDITQFGDEGVVKGIASIDVWNADYESVWTAFSFDGSGIELTLDGNTIRGTAPFYADVDEAMGDPVNGEVVANC